MLEKIDDTLGALSFFDLITPIYRVVRNLIEGPSFMFKIPHRAGWGIYTVKAKLQRAGCNPVWGLEIFDGEMRMMVKQAQAQRGYWALYRAGVPMINDVPKTRKKRR